MLHSAGCGQRQVAACSGLERSGVGDESAVESDRTPDQPDHTSTNPCVRGPSVVVHAFRFGPLGAGRVRACGKPTSFPAEVAIDAYDDSGQHYGPVRLLVDPWSAAHFNSGDLETGNVNKDVFGGTGPVTATGPCT